MKSQKPSWRYVAPFNGPVAGVDEAGRGPLAGPVVCAAVILEKSCIPKGLNDSKRLSEKRREELYSQIITCARYGIGIAEPQEIDHINILWASMAAMQRAVLDLPIKPVAVLVDGNRAPEFGVPTKTIIKGDGKCLSIAAASIIAKVTRDRIMHGADARFEKYGFIHHKGYATKIHQASLKAYGACPIHRRDYAPVKAMLT